MNHPLDVIAIASGRINIFFFIASAPTFVLNQLKKTIIVTKGQEVIIQCKPQGSPKPTISWKKGDKAVRENKRLEVYFIIQTLLTSNCFEVADDTEYTRKSFAVI